MLPPSVVRSGKKLLVFGSVLAGLAGLPIPAHADPLVQGQVGLVNACKPTKEKPYPVVLVHGQAGDFHGMTGISDRLTQEGYCVYATNYGFVEGGANGQDHLWISGDQISQFVDQVMSKTGAKMVDVVGHSAGTGVLDNFILKKGGGSKVHAFISFGGLHHPYAHLGIPSFADFDVHLPGLLAFGRRFFPNITVEQITSTLVSVFGLDPGIAATVKSPFVVDLFNAEYWNDLQGGPSEPPGTFLRFFTRGRTLRTHDAEPGICYTNIVGVADFLVGGSTGWQDESGNIENFLLTSGVTINQHADMIGDQGALDKMIEGLKKNCGNNAGLGTKSLDTLTTTGEDDTAAKQKEFEDAFLKALEHDHGAALGPRSDAAGGDATADEGSGGCTVSSTKNDGATCFGAFAVAALGFVALRRRRR